MKNRVHWLACLLTGLLVCLRRPPPVGPARPGPAGEALYGRCMGCHALQHDAVGPRHCGLLGRRAGSVAGFDYSTAMRRSGSDLDSRHAGPLPSGPLRVVPGTSMTHAGVDAAQDRADLIAYLQAVNLTCHKGFGLGD